MADGNELKVQTLDTIDLADLPRFSSGFAEFDRVLGGGIVPDSAILIGGEPHTGKSKLLFQTMCTHSQNMSALYITDEESLQQLAMRAQRLEIKAERLKLLSETSVENIFHIAEKEKPKIIVIDSIHAYERYSIGS
jgi:DNA repair protein RadA/Sms